MIYMYINTQKNVLLCARFNPIITQHKVCVIDLCLLFNPIITQHKDKFWVQRLCLIFYTLTVPSDEAVKNSDPVLLRIHIVL